MSNYATFVIRMPDDAEAKKQAQNGLRLLEPFRTAMSTEDEMSILECIEQHEDFPEYIAEEARATVARLHARAETTPITDAKRGRADAPLIQPPYSERMIVARRKDGTVEAAGWEGARTRLEAVGWLDRDLTLEYVPARMVRELLTKHRGGVFDTTAPVGDVLDYERAQREMMGF